MSEHLFVKLWLVNLKWMLFNNWQTFKTVILDAYVCKTCDRTYKHKSSLSRHKNVHKVRCNFCKRLLSKHDEKFHSCQESNDEKVIYIWYQIFYFIVIVQIKVIELNQTDDNIVRDCKLTFQRQSYSLYIYTYIFLCFIVLLLYTPDYNVSQSRSCRP